MKIIEKDKLSSDEFKLIKNGLQKSRQLTPETLSNIPYYARKWMFFFEGDNVLGHAAIKKSEREEYDIEIGFIYTYPDKQYSQEEIIYNLLKYINDKHSDKGIYAEVLLNPIKRIFKKIGYSKIDEWDSKVRKGNKVELYTNKNLMIISEDDMKSLWNYLEEKMNLLKSYDEALMEVDKSGKVTWGSNTFNVPLTDNKEFIDVDAFKRIIKTKGLLTDEDNIQIPEDMKANGIPINSSINVTKNGITLVKKSAGLETKKVPIKKLGKK